MNLQRLLKRMEFSSPTDELDMSLLNELCISFAASVPYETLDIFGGKRRILDLPLIYEEIVERNRGGMCIELNALFHWMLCEIGYNVKMCMAYDIPQDISLTKEQECRHMVLLAVLSDGDVWLTDVGWGGNSFIFPLSMSKLSEEQSQPNGIYMITKWGDFYVVEKKKQKQILADEQTHKKAPARTEEPVSNYQTSPVWNTLFSFRTEPRRLLDFENAFDYAQERHPFCTQNSCAILQDRHRRIFLIGDILIEKRYVDPSTLNVAEIRKLDKEELTRVLKDKFGIVLNFELQPKSQLNWSVV